MPILRPPQIKSIDGLRDGFSDGHRVQLLYGPTGFGKTEISISMMKQAAEKGNRVAMVMDRRVLVEQTSKRLDKYGIDHGVLMAGHWRYRPAERIQICTMQTLEARGAFPGLNLLIIDESHCQRKSVTEFIQNHPQVRVVGLSASPFTKGLGNVYSNVVSECTTKELVDTGMLTPLRVFIAKEVDMTGATKVAGEWSAKDAGERGIKITGDIVSEWVKITHDIYGEPRKTIVFCANVAHGEDLSRKFAEAGYNFVSISYKDDDEYKQDAIKDFERHDSSIHGIIACDILTKGYDNSAVSIGISARPYTKSFSSHVQQMGRVMRANEGKDFAVWIDHAGNFLRFRDQWEELYADGVARLDDDAEKVKRELTKKEKEAAKCPKCSSLWARGSDVCPHCGFVRQRKNEVVAVAGEMTELVNAKKPEKFSLEFKTQFYAELMGFAKDKGYKEGWAYWKYKERFSVGPAMKKPEPALPSIETMNWVTSRNIAAKAHRIAV